jgi:hypothetical protein
MIHRVLLVLLLTAMTVGAESCGVCPGGCCCAGRPGWGMGERVEGSGEVVRVERKVRGFTEVGLATIGTLHVEVGKQEALVIRGEENIVEHIVTEVRRGMLTISNERGYNLRPTEPLEYYLTIRDLEGVSLSSAGDAYIPDIEASRFRIRISSAGDLEARSIKAKHLDVRISSSGDATIGDVEARTLDVSISSAGDLAIGGGSVESQDVRISSSGSHRASRLRSRRADVRISSSGDAHIMVTEELDARLSSSGSVLYSGDPRIRQHRSSSGKLKRLDV